MKDRLKEVVSYLDCDIYWKQCNFLDESNLENGKVEFYSRDECKNISFKELLLWYLPRLGLWQDAPDCSECNEDCLKCVEANADRKVKEKHYELFLELIDIYVFYNSKDCTKYNELKSKLQNLIKE
jgi:hypothetical protein